ncbi:MAG: hypothetical protein WD000_00485 [Thermodesulfobacteriota bacterium]
MDKKFITKQCERCGAEVKVPSEYPVKEDILKWYQVTCERHCKAYTFDYHRMKWLK